MQGLKPRLTLNKPSYHSADLRLRRLKRRRMSSNRHSSLDDSRGGADFTPHRLSTRSVGRERRRGDCNECVDRDD